MIRRLIYCCGCGDHVQANLVGGKSIYPHRPDLFYKFFYQCKSCLNYVGIHSNSVNSKIPYAPLGVIPTKDVRDIRKKIHTILDPLWKMKGSSAARRKNIYKYISDNLKYKYHTAELRTVKEGETVYDLIVKYKQRGEK